MIRFHLDEHIDPAVAAALRRRGIDVTTTNEASLRTRPDDDQVAFVRAEGRVIVTRDQDFLRLHADGTEHAGIAFVKPATQSVAQVLDFLLLIHACMTPDEMRNRVEYV